MEKLCLGKPACSIEVDNTVFGEDPCHLTTKRLAVQVQCSPSTPDGNWRVTADEALAVAIEGWQVHYPFVDSDSAFTSSNPMLNKVWDLCKNTLKVTSLDTFTDSNTRERLPCVYVFSPSGCTWELLISLVLDTLIAGMICSRGASLVSQEVESSHC